ncbi:MAG: ABC transporter substrate-binding protein [Candidatus Dependentiae bacterium]|nr:ABC transporter substrate-binding protein [Candidatus Dependentiae bacterium]
MKLLRAAALLICSVTGLWAESRLQTLDDFVLYARTLPELTAWKGTWLDPDFEETFFALRPGVFALSADALGIHRLSWKVEDLRAALRASNERVKQAPPKKTLNFTVQLGTRYVFWGDLHGAFHSFLRDLKELERQGAITQDLTIREGYTFILLGDVINRSPYSLQMLSLVIALREKNPENFIYLAGQHEKDGYWKSFLTMRQPLGLYYRHWWESNLKKPEVSLHMQHELTEFFSYLPESIMLGYADNAEGHVFVGQDVGGHEEVLAHPSFKAAIVGETRKNLVQARVGLGFVGFVYGVSQWSILSSPIKVYQDHFHFYQDSYVILTIDQTWRRALLTEYHRDMRTDMPFEIEYMDLISAVHRKSEAEIREIQKQPLYFFGSTLALLRGAGSSGMPLKDGLEAAVLACNERGGVHGQLLYPVILDDSYDDKVAEQNVALLQEGYGIDVLVSPQGTPTLRRYLDRVKRGEIAVLFPRAGADQFYTKDLKYLVNSIAPVSEEVSALMDQMVNEFKVRDFAFMYPADSFGRPLMESVRAELKKYGIERALEVMYQQGQITLKDQAEELRESSSDGVGLFITGNTPVREVLSSLEMEFFLSRVVFTTSFLDSVSVNQFIADRGIEYTMSFPVPTPAAVELPIFKALDRIIRPLGLSYNSSLFEGYLAAELFIDALAHVALPFTKEKVIAYLEGLKNYDFGGLHLTFDPQRRDFGMPVFIVTSEGRWAEYQRGRRVAEGVILKPAAGGN